MKYDPKIHPKQCYPHTGFTTRCSSCVNYLRQNDDTRNCECKAYPNGIPMEIEIAVGRDTSYPCHKDYRFTPKKESGIE